jgi:hypothetical protein
MHMYIVSTRDECLTYFQFLNASISLFVAIESGFKYENVAFDTDI